MHTINLPKGLFFPSLLCLILLFFSCKKEAGEGGAAVIKGKLLTGNYHSPGIAPTAEDGATAEPVYIIYGDQTVADHSEKTNHDGSFEFRYLRPGKYTIYAYTLDKNISVPVETVTSKIIEITDKKASVEVTDFIIYKKADKDGSSGIRGRVYLRDYDLAFTSLQNQYYKPDEDVFLIFGKDTIYDKDTKSGNEGWYQFEELRKGIYQVYSYSVDSAEIVRGENSPPKIPIIKTVEITANKQIVQVPDIVILKN